MYKNTGNLKKKQLNYIYRSDFFHPGKSDKRFQALKPFVNGLIWMFNIVLLQEGINSHFQFHPTSQPLDPDFSEIHLVRLSTHFKILANFSAWISGKQMTSKNIHQSNIVGHHVDIKNHNLLHVQNHCMPSCINNKSYPTVNQSVS